LCRPSVRGSEAHISTAHESSATVSNRWSRDRTLAAPCSRRNTPGAASSAYWRRRILRAYLAAAHWSWKRGQYGASRTAYALLSLGLAGPALLASPYWQALRDEHAPQSALKVVGGL
jgi:hypothetical protein